MGVVPEEDKSSPDYLDAAPAIIDANRNAENRAIACASRQRLVDKGQPQRAIEIDQALARPHGSGISSIVGSPTPRWPFARAIQDTTRRYV